MDYSGSVADRSRELVREGITYHDDPGNPGYPSSWHVRGDGFMVASLNMHSPLKVGQGKSLTVRYLLHIHAGDIDKNRAESIHSAFKNSPSWELKKSSRPHTTWEVTRVER